MKNIAILLFGLTIVASCSNTKTTETTTLIEETPSLDGNWILSTTTIPNFEVKKGTSLKFEKNNFYLNALCNVNSGAFKRKENEITFQKEGFIQTRKACLDNYEADLIKILFTIKSVAIQNDILTLTTNDEVKLVFKKFDLKNEITSKTWRVTSSTEGGITISEDNPELTMTFSKDGKVAGFAGCNNFNAVYTLEGNLLEIKNAALTKMACMPEASKIESNFVSNLNKATFTVEYLYESLELRDNQGAITFILN